MQPSPPAPAAVARLVTAVDGPPRHYRPLIAGPAVLERTPSGPSWTVAIACERRLVPRAPSRMDDRACRHSGRAVRSHASRVAIALVSPLDAGPAPGHRHVCRESVPALRLDFYGWALLYQPPGMRGRAVVDGNERFADLPAVFELPLELIARAEFLESRGFRTRPLLVPVLPGDFVTAPDGRLRNRFLPGAGFRHPFPLEGLP